MRLRAGIARREPATQIAADPLVVSTVESRTTLKNCPLVGGLSELARGLNNAVLRAMAWCRRPSRP